MNKVVQTKEQASSLMQRLRMEKASRTKRVTETCKMGQCYTAGHGVDCGKVKLHLPMVEAGATQPKWMVVMRKHGQCCQIFICMYDF